MKKSRTKTELKYFGFLKFKPNRTETELHWNRTEKLNSVWSISAGFFSSSVFCTTLPCKLTFPWLVFSLGFRFVYVQEVEKYFYNKKWRVVIHIAKGFTARHNALMHSRQLYYTAKGFTTQQKALLHNRNFYYTANGFIAQQKVLLHSRKVRPVAKTGEKFLLWQK